jgi:hypothetical protein
MNFIIIPYNIFVNNQTILAFSRAVRFESEEGLRKTRYPGGKQGIRLTAKSVPEKQVDAES